MRSYDELKALIEQRGVHPEFGDAGEGWGIEQNPHELATFLVRMQELGVVSCLEIGTGYKGGLSRFLAQDMGWDVTTVDIKNYGYAFEGVHYIVGDDLWKMGFRHNQFDLIFIDGNHSREAVGRDSGFAVFQGAKVVAFHDICGLRDCKGVTEVWRIGSYINGKLTPGHYEIIDDSPRRSGIGYYVYADMPLFIKIKEITAEEFYAEDFE